MGLGGMRTVSYLLDRKGRLLSSEASIEDYAQAI